MNFARHRHLAQSPWRSLALGLWLFSFVFSFAFSDRFHSATCPEQALLKWTAHANHVSVHPGVAHLAGVDVDCSACAFQRVALAIVTASVWALLFSHFTLRAQNALPVWPNVFSTRFLARGPPVFA